MTQLIQFWAGPGAGKSTTSSALFAHMKKLGINCELVQEYAKDWAWEGKPIEFLDQVYLFSKQLKREKRLYGQVDFIITDCPLAFCDFYHKYYNNSTAMTGVLQEIEDYKRKLGIETTNFFLNRTKTYNPKGRYQTAEQAMELDNAQLAYLESNEIPFNTVENEDQVLARYVDLRNLL